MSIPSNIPKSDSSIPPSHEYARIPRDKSEDARIPGMAAKAMSAEATKPESTGYFKSFKDAISRAGSSLVTASAGFISDRMSAYLENGGAKKAIAASEQRMMCLDDSSQFIGFQRVASESIAEFISSGYLDGLNESGIKLTKEEVKDLIKMNIAHGFANLAEKIHDKNADISSANSLTIMISLIHEAISKEFPIPVTDDPNAVDADLKNAALKDAAFKRITDDIIGLMFPEGVPDLQLPGLHFLTNLPIVGRVSNVLQFLLVGKIAPALSGIYTTFKADLDKTNAQVNDWTSDIQGRMGVQGDLSAALGTPTALVKEYALSYVNSNPTLVKTIANKLAQNSGNPKPANERPSEAGEAAAVPSESVNEEMTASIENQEVAAWLLDSVRGILRTKDPELLKSAQFAQDCLTKFTLGLLAKGADVIMPKKEEVQAGDVQVGVKKEDAFLKELMTNAFQKFNSLRQHRADSREDNIDLVLGDWINAVRELKGNNKEWDGDKVARGLVDKFDAGDGSILAEINGGEWASHIADIVEKVKVNKEVIVNGVMTTTEIEVDRVVTGPEQVTRLFYAKLEESDPLFNEIKAFVKGLPFAVMLDQNSIAFTILTKLNDLSSGLNKVNASWDAIKASHAQALKELKGYPAADGLEGFKGYPAANELALISKSISDKIVEDMIIAKGANVVGSQDMLDELFVQYLPNVKIDPQLKAWLKENILNISANKPSVEGQPDLPAIEGQPDLVAMLKTAIDSILLQSFVKAVKKSEGDGKDTFEVLKDLAAQFKKFGIPEGERVAFDEAVVLQDKIREFTTPRDVLLKKQTEIKESVKSLPDAFKKCFKKVFNSKLRLSNAQQNTRKLERALDASKDKLNADKIEGESEWNDDKFTLSAKAFNFQRGEKGDFDKFESLQAVKFLGESNYQFYTRLKGSLVEKLKFSNMRKAAEYNSELDALIFLIELSSMPKKRLEIIYDCVNLRDMIVRAEGEEKLLPQDSSEAELKGMDEKVLKDDEKKAWENAKNFLLPDIVEGLVTGFVEDMKRVGDYNAKILLLETELGKQFKEKLGEKGKEALNPKYLKSFKTLSEGLFQSLGFANLDDLPLDADLKAWVQPYFDGARDKQVPRLLFDMLSSKAKLDREHESNAQALKDKSPGLSNLCESLSKIAEGFTTTGIQSFQTIGASVCKALAPLAPGGGVIQEEDPKKIAQFSEKLGTMYKNWIKPHSDPQYKAIGNKLILEAYKEVFGLELNRSQTNEYLQKLHKVDAKNEMMKIYFTPDDIIGMVLPKGLEVLGLKAGDLKESSNVFADLLHKLTHPEPGSFNLVQQFTPYINEVLTKVLLNAVTKLQSEPGAEDQDPMVLITKKVLDVSTKMYGEFKVEKEKCLAALEEKNPEVKAKAIKELVIDMSKKFTDQVLKDALGIESADSFEGLAPPVQQMVYGVVREQAKLIIEKTLSELQHLQNTDVGVQKAHENLEILFGNTCMTYIVEDLGDYALDAAMSSMRGTLGIPVPKSAGDLNRVVQDNLKLAQMLLNYGTGVKSPALGDAVDMVEPARAFAAEMGGNFLVKPINNAVDKLFKLEKSGGKVFNETLITRLMDATGEHLKLYNQAKAKAKKEGRDLTHADFVAVAGNELHAAVPHKLEGELLEQVVARNKFFSGELEGIDFESFGLYEGAPNEAALNMDAERLYQERQEHFYEPLNDQLIHALFPNGHEDLAFVPPDLRYAVWGSLEKLGQSLLPMVVDSMLHQDTMRGIVLKSLKDVNTALIKAAEVPAKKDGKGVSVVDDKKSEPLESLPDENASKARDDLDLASGEVVLQLLDMTKLPPGFAFLIKGKDGKVREGIQKAIGNNLRAQFSGDLIKRTLVANLGVYGKPDKDGNLPSYKKEKFGPSPEPVEGQPSAEPVKKQTSAEMDAEISQLTNEAVDNALGLPFRKIGNTVRYMWDTYYHAKVDKAIANLGILSKPVKGLKDALDFTCKVIFFKIAGSLISLALSPVTYLVKTGVKHYVNHNRQAIMDIFTKVPEDQITTTHAFHNEQLAYSLIGVMVDVFQDFEKQRQVEAQVEKEFNPLLEAGKLNE